MDQLTRAGIAAEQKLRKQLTERFVAIRDALAAHVPLGIDPQPCRVAEAAQDVALLASCAAEARLISAALADLGGTTGLLIAGSSNCALLVVEATIAEMTADLDAQG